jgi:hypothetical protein
MTKWIPYQDDWTCWRGEAGYHTKERAIEAGKILYKGRPFSVAEKVDWEFRQFQVDDMIETAEQEVQDHEGEFATPWQVSEDMYAELQTMVHEAFHKWAVKHRLYPYNIKNIERIVP